MSEQPFYDLGRVKDLARRRHIVIWPSATAEARATLAFDDADIRDCLLELTPTDFVKNLPPQRPGGSPADVYKPRFAGKPCYVKFSLQRTIDGGTVVVISFRLK